MAEMISTAEAAKLLGISRGRVLVLIGEGRLPAQRVGSQHIINKKDLATVRDRKPGRPRKKK